MKTRELNLILPCLVLSLLLCTALAAFPGHKSSSPSDVSATVECKEIGRLNGVVQYQYDVTLTNNTKKKLRVDYTVTLYAGDVPKKSHSHSTILIPSENSTETNSGSMKQSDWDLVSRFNVKWSSSEIK